MEKTAESDEELHDYCTEIERSLKSKAKRVRERFRWACAEQMSLDI